ncbi:uncharacterized protein DUF3308 [Flavobacterium glaciei]|uniref:Uncharacterized protein DUF3308 n=2 Tax=Flavobacterium glaciei TaxID=386300 RepID=A0A562PHW8_9FLAO|nr:uncharacterized protein DUF3308 [Flavobacterium glaciei]
MLFLQILGTGVYFNSDKLYFSFSILRFLKRQHFDDNTATVFNDKIHCYFMGGYVFNVSQSVKLKPSFLTRLVSGGPLQVDVAANVLWQDKFSFGL